MYNTTWPFKGQLQNAQSLTQIIWGFPAFKNRRKKVKRDCLSSSAACCKALIHNTGNEYSHIAPLKQRQWQPEVGICMLGSGGGTGSNQQEMLIKGKSLTTLRKKTLPAPAETDFKILDQGFPPDSKSCFRLLVAESVYRSANLILFVAVFAIFPPWTHTFSRFQPFNHLIK